MKGHAIVIIQGKQVGGGKLESREVKSQHLGNYIIKQKKTKHILYTSHIVLRLDFIGPLLQIIWHLKFEQKEEQSVYYLECGSNGNNKV